MSVFERLHQRFTRSSTPNRANELNSTNNNRVPDKNFNRTDKVNLVTVSSADELRPRTPQLGNTNNPLTVTGYDFAQGWTGNSAIKSNRQIPIIVTSNSSSNSSAIYTNTANATTTLNSLSVNDVNATYHPAFQQSQEALNTMVNISGFQSNQLTTTHVKRAKTPVSSFYRVSSEEEDEESEEEENDEQDEEESDNIQDEKTTNWNHGEHPFGRKSQRLRRSIDKAKAALPPDFADRIAVGPINEAPSNQDSSVSRTRKNNNCQLNLSNEDLLAQLSERDTSSDEHEDQNQKSEPDFQTSPKNYENSRQNEHNEVFNRISHMDDPTLSHIQGHPDNSITGNSNSTAELSTNSEIITDFKPQTGIVWQPGSPKPLIDLMPDICSNGSGTAYLMKAICKRTGCRCALRNYDSLMLFTVPEASLASATWELWSHSGKSHGQFPPTTCEVQARLILFRQCYGWYEVLNENHQAVPYLTTLEQVRRTRSTTFIVRQDLRCLVLPPSFVIPLINESRKTNEGPSRTPFSSSVISHATAPETLSNSKPEIIRAGTLLRYITFLPRCPFKRGRKVKELGLILAVERSHGSLKQQVETNEKDGSKVSNRAFFIGTEDGTPAVFPSKIALSPVAGPENISGVHSLASILRKFRLPLSVRPVPMPDPSTLDSLDSGMFSNRSPMNPVAKTKLACGLAAIQSLAFTERHFLRLLTIHRGAILIIAPVASPERLFLITPSMLKDHIFQIGSSQDPAYLSLLETHRIQASNFLATAHPQETLNYLVRHMQDITREPRDSYSSRLQVKPRPDLPPPPESYMTPEEIYKAYEELDEIYFYIRHGYYPSKSRKSDEYNQPRIESQVSSSRVPKTPISSNHLDDVNHEDVSRAPNISTAEDLLAASITTTNMLNSINPATYRVQPKEYGI